MANLRSRVILTMREVTPAPAETHAERFYYEKQIESGGRLAVSLLGNVVVRGRLLWYDIDTLGLDDGGRERVVAKKDVKYIWKEEDEPAQKRSSRPRIRNSK